MGGGKSSSEQRTESNVTTTTTTSIGDIGLTGNDAVALAGVLEQGSIDRAIIQSQAGAALYQGVGNAYNQLIAGAGNFLVQQTQANRDNLNAGLSLAKTAIQTAPIAQPANQMNQQTKLAIAAAVAVTIIAVVRK